MTKARHRSTLIVATIMKAIIEKLREGAGKEERQGVDASSSPLESLFALQNTPALKARSRVDK